MKKIIIAICALVLCVSAVGGTNWVFGNHGGVKVHYNNCTVYSKEDIDSAAQVVIEQADSMEDSMLFSLKYITADELEYCRSLNKDADYVESIAFASVLRGPIIGGPVSSNRLHTWTWHLAREQGGEWELLTWGYA